MSYSTPTEVRLAAFPDGGAQPPADPTGTAADLSDATLQDAISEADATIDAYLSGRYVTPVPLVLNLVPHPIDWWSRNIALYLATLTQRGSQDFTDTDPVARRYNATIEALTAVQAGKASLPTSIAEIGAGDGSGAATGAGNVINQYPTAMFDQSQFEIYNPTQGPVTDNPFGTTPYSPNSPWIR